MQKIIKEYRSLQAMMRAYDHESWHAVNVKRYHDYIKPEEIAKEAGRLSKRFKNTLIEYSTQYAEDNDAYNLFLSDQSESLKNDLLDNFTFKHIKMQGERKQLDYKTRCNACRRLTWYESAGPCHVTGCAGRLEILSKPIFQDDRSYIYQLGRSGGWICFQDTAEDIAGELEDYAGGNKDLLTPEDLQDHIAGLTEAVKEIEDLKQYIAKFNAEISWKDEVFYRMNEKLDELKAEAEEEKQAINNRSNTSLTLAELLDHKNEAIKRNAIGILKQLNKK